MLGVNFLSIIIFVAQFCVLLGIVSVHPKWLTLEVLHVLVPSWSNQLCDLEWVVAYYVLIVWIRVLSTMDGIKLFHN